MRKILSTERMIELENNLNNEKMLEDLTKEETEYIKLAKKLPYNELVSIVEDYLINWYYRNDVFISRNLIDKYSCSEIELFRRILDIDRIIEHNEKKLNNELKEQKQLVKKHTNNRI